MAGRWETLILLLCELSVSVFAETVEQQREEVQDKKTEEVCRSKKRIILLYVIQMEKHFFQKEVKRFIDC